MWTRKTQRTFPPEVEEYLEQERACLEEEMAIALATPKEKFPPEKESPAQLNPRRSNAQVRKKPRS